MRLAKRMVALITISAAVAGAGCSAASDDGSEEGAAAVSQAGDVPPLSLRPVEMSDAERKEVVEKKATCPFVGAMVRIKKLPVLNSLGNPLARIKDIEELGAGAGGSLGRVVLKLFATGNHHRMHGIVRNAAGQNVYTKDLTADVPQGTFSLDFPPAQGSHPGHSGILEGGARGSYHGAIDEQALDRLLSRAVDERGRHAGERGFTGAKYVKRSDMGDYIWENVSRDPESVYVGHGFSAALLDDLLALKRDPSVEKIVKLTGTNNLVGSAGEWALLMVLLEVPDLKVDGQPVVRVSDLRQIFVDRTMPAGWDARPLEASRWVHHTMGLLASAERGRF